MARLQLSGPIGVSQINSLRGLSGPSSIATRENQLMGGNPANAATGVCFPGQTQRVSSTNWTYNGATTPWRPTRFSEFYGAYNGRPSVSVTSSARNNARTNMFMTAQAAGSDVGAPYSFWAENVAGGIGGSGLNGWVVANANGNTRYTWSLTNNGSGTATLRVYVRDSLNCGTMKEFSGTGTYP